MQDKYNKDEVAEYIESLLSDYNHYSVMTGGFWGIFKRDEGMNMVGFMQWLKSRNK